MRTRPIPAPVRNDVLLVLSQVLHAVPGDVEAQHLPVPQQLGAAQDAGVRHPLRQVVPGALDELVHEFFAHLRGKSSVNFLTI